METRLVEQTEAHILVGLLLLCTKGLTSGRKLWIGKCENKPSSFFSSGAASAAAPPEAAAGAAAPPPPPLGTEASFSEPAAINYTTRSVHCVFSVVISRRQGGGGWVTYLVDVLALKLLNELVEALVVGLDTDRLENGLDVGGRGRGVASKAEEKVSSEMLHFVGGIFWPGVLVDQGTNEVARGSRRSN